MRSRFLTTAVTISDVSPSDLAPVLGHVAPSVAFAVRRVPRGAWLLSVVLLVSSHCLCGAGVRGPAIVKSNGQHELVLPPEMTTAIQKAVPGFRTETLKAYHADVQKYYRFTSRQAPWAVVGDFDGDGLQDVILDGNANGRCYRLCVWGRSKPVVDTLSTRPCHGRVDALGVLMFVPPGERGTNFSNDVVFIYTDAYDDYGWEKAGSTWYWKDGRWNEFFSSD
jgi:hypothetical protein